MQEHYHRPILIRVYCAHNLSPAMFYAHEDKSIHVIYIICVCASSFPIACARESLGRKKKKKKKKEKKSSSIARSLIRLVGPPSRG